MHLFPAPPVPRHSVAQSAKTFMIGDKGYATLAEAVNAADDGDTIVLVDEEGYTTGDSEAIDFADDITLDMNGKTLNLSPTAMKSQLIKVLEGAELTLTNGTVVIDGNNDGNRGVNIHGTLNIACIVDCSAGGAGAAFDIYQGTVNVLPEADITAGYETFRLKDENLTSAINIKGGKIVNGQSNTMINNYKPGHVLNLTIEGGDISNGSAVFRNVDGAIINLELGSTCEARFNNIKCNLNGTMSTLNDYVVDGYALMKDGDWYVVGKKNFAIILADTTKGYASTLEGAIAAAVAGDTIKMLADYTAGDAENLTFTQNGVTLDLGGFTLSTPTAVHSAQKFGVANGAEVTLKNGTIVENMDGVNRGMIVNGTVNVQCTVKEGPKGCAGALFDMYEGTVNVQDGADLQCGYEIFRGKDDNLTSTVNISGGTITKGSSGPFFYNYKPGHVFDITITGGDIICSGRWFFTDTANVYNMSLGADCAAKFKIDPAQLDGYIAEGYALVKGDDNWYTIQQVFDITITEPENGMLETSVTNGVVAGTEVTVTATPATGFELESITTNGTAITGTTFEMPAEAVTVAATFKSAGPVWPDLPAEFPADADDGVKAKYADWAKAYNVTDASGLSDAFLMNVDPTATVPELKIDSITVEGNTATIVVGAQGVNLETGINGKLFVDGTDELGAKWDSTVIDATAESFKDGKATFTVPNAKFMKARVDFKVPEVPAE